MDAKQYIVKSLTGNIEFLKDTLKDFSDADLFVRPCPGANHAAWQLGHLIGAETHLIGALDPKGAIALPDDFAARFSKETSTSDDPAKFGKYATKNELLGLFDKVRNATIAWVNTLSPDDFDNPSPEKFRSWAPTWGDMVGMQPGHVAMHVGQFQVIRRKTGKPVLF